MKLTAAKKLFSFKKMLLTSSLFLLTSAFIPMQTFASIILTELHPNPSDGPEWIELYNTSSEAQSLEHWELEDQLSSPSTLITFSSQDVIAAHSTFVVELSSNKLNNAADGVVLYNAEHTSVDTTQYDSPIEKDMSWSRQKTEGREWLTTVATKGIYTPASPMSSSAPTATPSATVTPQLPTPSPLTTSPSPTTLPTQVADISVREVQACPRSGEKESITLFNNEDTSVSLESWFITDAVGNKRLLAGSIPPHSALTSGWSSSMLNNTGDTITLFSPSGEPIEILEYEHCITGTAITFVNGIWQSHTPLPTPSKSPLKKQETTTSPIAATISANLNLSKTSPLKSLLSFTLPTQIASSSQEKHQMIPTTTLSQRDPPKQAILHVILGGVCIILSGIINLMVHEQQYAKKRKTVTFFLK